MRRKKADVSFWAMAKIGYTRKPDGQNRVPPSTLVPGRHLIGQRPPRPDSGRISNGSARFWLLIRPSATRFQSHLPDYGRAIRPAAHLPDASSRDAAGHLCGLRGRACGRTFTLLCSVYVMRLLITRVTKSYLLALTTTQISSYFTKH